MTGTFSEKANENFREAFVKSAEHAQNGEYVQFGPVTATATGTNIPAFNQIFALKSAPREEIERAIGWMKERELPFWLTVTKETREEVAEIAQTLDLVDAESSQPGMVLPSLDSIPERSSSATIDIVTDIDEVREVRPIFADVFEVPLEIAEDLLSETLLSDDNFEILLGRVNGQPVACGSLIQHDTVAGVYSVATLGEFRQRGIGTELTREVLRVGRDRGCRLGVLQSSDIGYSVYEKMGFESIVEYHRFEMAE